ncbi:MAG: potassium/proton antiporter [Alistipes sp.]|nr:potassium/proton antiporter [Alistipes sp.]MBQ7342180.1 potassium/proton antiporter [Alistipes sp.]
MIGGENYLLVGAVLLIIAVFAGKVAYRFGAPALLLFLGVGMFFGYNFISFDSAEFAQVVGMVALCIILFSGGMDTRFSEIRPVMSPGVMLATVGVILTAFIVAGFVWLVAPLLGISLTFPFALLLAATMSSTDSASVFSILRTKKQGLRENLRPLLELESGSNDPMAYILTVLLVGILSGSGHDGVSIGSSVFMFFVQMFVGVLLGYGLGRGTVWVINHINIANTSLYSVLLLASVFLTFSFTSLLQGNGYLAVYIAGLVVGNNKLAHKRTLATFFDSFTWLCQVIMFLTLGLLVNVEELLQPDIVILGCLVGAFMILVARPVSVFACLAPFRKFSMKARLYVSWVGLRGAVPIIFATYPVVEHIDGAEMLFNIVFFVTLISMAVQGTTVSGMANALGLAYEERESSFGEELQERMTAAFSEVEVNMQMLLNGDKLSEISLPDNTLVVMICRDGDYFVPRGNTELLEGDKLLILSDRGDELDNQYKEFGVEEVLKF